MNWRRFVADTKKEWTKEQKDVIEDKGHSLLVSASAGSGKTSVMTERISRLVSDASDPTPISNILTLTFTKASAEDMRKKIIERLESLDESDYVLEQIDAVMSADISDLHSFYSRLLSLYFYEVGVDPGYHIIDEVQAENLKNRAIDVLFEKLEAEGSSIHIRLIDMLQDNRSDERLKEIIFGLSEFLNSLPEPDEWFENTLKSSYSDDLNSNPCAKIINEYCSNFAEDLASKAEEFANNCYSVKCQQYGEFFDDVASKLRAIKVSNDFLINSKNMFELDFGKRPTIGNEFDELKKEAENLLDKIKKQRDKLQEVFVSYDENFLKSSLNAAKDEILQLFDLVKKFEAEYNSQKQMVGGLDFADLERFAYKILQNEEIATAVKNKYKYVFVDEYQDINKIQEKIISMLSTKNNLFMVGDVKQSIYGFRLCDPEIFLNKMEEFSSDGETSKLFKLNTNFRSDVNILNFINLVFSGVMTKDFGGIDYKNEACLVQGTNNKNLDDAVKLIYIDTTKNLVQEEAPLKGIYSVKNHVQEIQIETKAMEAEAKIVADNIAKIRKVDKKFKLSDVCVLVTRRGKKIQEFKAALQRLNVSVSASEKYDLCKKNYITEILNFEKLLINSKDDFLLFLVLKSRFFAFSDSEIAEIRSICPSIDFCDIHFLHKSIKNVKLSQKFDNFYKIIIKFREFASLLSIKELTKKIIDEFGLYKINLLTMYGKKINLELDNFLNNLPDENAYEFLSQSENFKLIEESFCLPDAVNIMTVHGSKGLEFKYVFLVNTTASIIFSDPDDVSFQKDLGIAMSFFDVTKRFKKKTIVNSAMSIIQNKKTIEEAQRLLYVALTRAKEKLFVICSKREKTLVDTFPKVPLQYSSWFEPIISNELNGRHLGNYIFEKYNLDELALDDNFSEKQLLLSRPTNIKPDKKIFEYPYETLTKIPLKTSVSKILGNSSVPDEDFDDEYERQEYERDKETSSSYADRGTAYHRCFELIDLKNKGNFDEEIKNAKFALGEKASLVDEKLIKNILNLPFFANILDTDIVIKEREFFAEVSANLLGYPAENSSEAKVILQGVIDLVIVRNGQLHLLDYKTGRFSQNKLKKYKFQIETYAEVASRAFNMPVKNKFICFVDEGKLLEI